MLKSALLEEKRRTGSDSGRTNVTETASDVFRHRSRTGKSYCRTRSDVGSERVNIPCMIITPLTPMSSNRRFPYAFLEQFFLGVSPFIMSFIPPTILVHLITTNNAMQKCKHSGIPKYCNFLYLHLSLCLALSMFIAFLPVTNVLVRLNT
jgi:hypothetical protein